MVSLWRFTRNRYARAVYDALQAVGITATRMYEYQVRVDHPDAIGSQPAPDGVTIEVVSASEVRARGVDLDFSLPVDVLDGELVVIASADGNPIGRTVVNPDAVCPPARTIGHGSRGVHPQGVECPEDRQAIERSSTASETWGASSGRPSIPPSPAPFEC